MRSTTATWRVTRDLTVYAQWEKGSTYDIKHYKVDRNRKRITNIEPNTNLTNYYDYFALGEDYRIEVSLQDKNYIYTGSKTKIYQNNVLIEEFTNVVLGDINGDGMINSMDLLKLRQNLLDKEELVDAYASAADTTGDNEIDSNDLSSLRQYLLGINSII